MMFSIELGLVLMALPLAFAFPRLGSRGFEAGERILGRLAQSPRCAVGVVGFCALAARAALLPILPIPVPEVHDEFSYLLAADTFAHGRLANPPHPMWIHFETYHVLWHPAYASMYPPAQGLIMAFGQAVLGHPFWGVWLSVGLMCAAICWMLQAWLPPKWAVLGGLLAVIQFATFSRWDNCYFGGAVAATGGALVYGALPHLKQSLRVADALLLGLGLAILANSRPYEGLIFSLPVAAALLVWMLGKNRPPFRASLRRLVLPTALLLGLVAVLMGYYCWRVTGSPWYLPQLVNRQIYAVAPYFVWQSPRPIPAYHHALMKKFYLTYELAIWAPPHSLADVLGRLYARALQLWSFYLPPMFALPLVMSLVVVPYGFSWRRISPGTRFLLAATAFGLAGYALEVFMSPTYTAPGTCLVFAFVLAAMRNVRSWQWRQKPVGLAIVRAIPLIAGILLVLSVAGGPSLRAQVDSASQGGYALMLDRARIEAKLEQEPGRHLVIVKYSPTHSPHLEWVYNGADIDASKVVWARDMGREQNAELLSYFPDRRIWLVEPDLSPPRLSAYMR
jgi:hypothetical protein